MEYLGSVLSSIFSIIFIIFLVSTLGYLVGAIEVKGISLGTAGVLLVALLYGVFVSKVPSFTVGGHEITLFSADIRSRLSLVSSLGTVIFVSAVGLIAGPKFFRNFSKATMSYVYMGAITILIGSAVTLLCTVLDRSMPKPLAVGLMAGALTSTPGLSAAKEVAGDSADLVTAGYGIAYLFGVLGVVLFVQIVPKLLKVNVEEEKKKFVVAETKAGRTINRPLKKIEPLGFLPFFLTVALGCVIGAIKIPGINFSLGNSGGCLIAGLIIGHFSHFGSVDLRLDKSVLNFLRELGLVFFLIGAGIPGGVNFVANIKLAYFLYGALITLVPMVLCYYIGSRLFKLDVFNNLGSITGGMTSTPALGSLIATAETDDVTASYAATYPIALAFITIAAKVLILAG